MTGSWKIDVSTGRMPQRVATAVGRLNEILVGAEYTPIAYLGSQVVNGTNYAILAEQLITTGKDTKNIVVLIFNEKPGNVELTLVNIERVLEGGAPLGGTTIDVQMPISSNNMEIWDKAFKEFIGTKIVPFVYLGSQVTKGTDYIFIATVAPVTLTGEKKVCIVTINDMLENVTISNLFQSKQEASLGYAFTW